MQRGGGPVQSRVAFVSAILFSLSMTMDHQPSLAGALAHELRNALSPARAALEHLQRREAAIEALQPALRTMDRSFAATLQTIDRFVDAARILDGTINLEVVPGNLGRLLER